MECNRVGLLGGEWVCGRQGVTVCRRQQISCATDDWKQPVPAPVSHAELTAGILHTFLLISLIVLLLLLFAVPSVVLFRWLSGCGVRLVVVSPLPPCQCQCSCHRVSGAERGG